ncbi:DUF6059 family protein [Streptomyces sp. NPDC127092]|uniref:DUF6059 family protein n=1 Tax=Streptomyces sp. NPDC127092 TaxID=3347135 RepID=UPI003667F30A
MARRGGGWWDGWLRWLQPGLVAYGMFWGLTPPTEWLTEGQAHPPRRSPRPGAAPAPGHPERLVPHVRPSPAEQALWRQLTSGPPGVPKTGHADRLP